MDRLTTEIEKAMDAELFYAAVVLSLMLPDICAALESDDGETRGARYKAWCETWFLTNYPRLTGEDLYNLRCGVVHQGRLGHRNMQYARILFTVPNDQNNFFHNNIINDALNLDVMTFCNDMVRAIDRWFVEKCDEPNVLANLPRLVQYHPNGLAPYMVGMPLIA